MESTSQPTLRGAGARTISGRFWYATGTFLLGVFAVLIVVTFLSATNDNARIDRLKNHGVAVTVVVTSCVGNIGGSGSNAAGYTCRGSYRVHGVLYHEVIGSMTTLSAAGTPVAAIADPSRPSTIELATTVARSSSSSSVYVVPCLLAALLLLMAYALLRRWTTFRSRNV